MVVVYLSDAVGGGNDWKWCTGDAVGGGNEW